MAITLKGVMQAPVTPLKEEHYTPHQVTLSPYWIGKFEVTWRQYATFCEQTAYGPPYYGPSGAPMLSIQARPSSSTNSDGSMPSKSSQTGSDHGPSGLSAET